MNTASQKKPGRNYRQHEFFSNIQPKKEKMEGLVPYLPLVAILGPILGALIGALVTYRFVVKRKRVNFFIHHTEDLTLPLQQQQSMVVFRVGNSEVLNLNRALILIKNTGNTAISNFEFDVEVPNQHSMCIAESFSENRKLAGAIDISRDETRGGYNPTFTIKVPFFNAKERFSIRLFFDNTSDEVAIHCRMEDVLSFSRDADFINSNTWQAAILRGVMSGLTGFPVRFSR